VRRLALVLGLVVLLAGCGDDGEAEQPETGAAATAAAPVLDPRCIAVNPIVSNAVGSGLKAKSHALALAHAVKSDAFGSVFFVSARVDGAPSEPIATWATNNLSFGGVMFSIDPVAKKLSRWGDGAKFRPKLTMSLDGARLSRTCVKQASRQP
jgi:hypothetical protein